MNNFKDLQVTQKTAGFEGEKIKISKILNTEIIIHDFKLGPSKYDGERLDMQITYKEEKRLVWTSSHYLADALQQIPKDKFPILTTIVEIDDRYVFT